MFLWEERGRCQNTCLITMVHMLVQPATVQPVLVSLVSSSRPGLWLHNGFLCWQRRRTFLPQHYRSCAGVSPRGRNSWSIYITFIWFNPSPHVEMWADDTGADNRLQHIESFSVRLCACQPFKINTNIAQGYQIRFLIVNAGTLPNYNLMWDGSWTLTLNLLLTTELRWKYGVQSSLHATNNDAMKSLFRVKDLLTVLAQWLWSRCSSSNGHWRLAPKSRVMHI